MPYKDPEKKKASDKEYKAVHRGEIRAYHRAYNKKYAKGYNQRPEVKKRVRLFQLRSWYGLTKDAYESMLAGQGGVCAVCHTDEWGGKCGTPVVEHNHTTGKVRGIVCQNCNVAIGRVRDNPGIARAMADYLENNA